MSNEIFKAPKTKRPAPQETENWSPVKKKKMRGFDLLSFCDIVLQYTKYESMKQEELRQNSTSPLDSGGSTADSLSSESTISCYTEDENSRFDVLPQRGTDESRVATYNDDKDEDDSITCFCLKPYAGRPMIQCEDCLRWIHYSCAKIRKNKIPDIFICQKCRDNKGVKRKSNRMSPSSQKLSPSTS